MSRDRMIIEDAIERAINYIERTEINSIGTPYTYTENGKKLLEIMKDKSLVDYIENILNEKVGEKK
jgi:hypothetical protein